MDLTFTRQFTKVVLDNFCNQSRKLVLNKFSTARSITTRDELEKLNRERKDRRLWWVEVEIEGIISILNTYLWGE